MGNMKMQIFGVHSGILILYLRALLISGLISLTLQTPEEQMSPTKQNLPTVTVRGFLNFKTTVDGTVIVFTPAEELPQATTDTPKSTNTHPSVVPTNAILHSNAVDLKDSENVQNLAYTQAPNHLKADISDLEQHLGHRVKDPFLQHISDNAVLPSTVRTNNDLETSINKRNPAAQSQYPTGLVTILDGTHTESGSTTVFETKVIGTYIEGKYAQILQSTSKIIVPTTIYTQSYKTVSNSLKFETMDKPINDLQTLSEIKSSVSFPTTRSLTTSSDILNSISPVKSEVIQSSASINDNTNSISEIKQTQKNILANSVTSLQSSFQTTDVSTEDKVTQPTKHLSSVKTSRYLDLLSSYKTLVSRTLKPSDHENTVLSSKNTRTNSTRIRFITPRRPSQSVRLNRFKVKLTLRHDSSDNFDLHTGLEEDDTDDDDENVKEEDRTEGHTLEDSEHEVKPANVVYRETTITSEVTLHVGRRKSVRTLTITTSVPLTINPTESQLLYMTSEIDQDMIENAPVTQSVISSTYTTTERTMQTSIVPVFDGQNTGYHTITENFFIMKIITAYKTLPPGGVTILTEDPVTTEPTDATLEVSANIQPSVVQSVLPPSFVAENSSTELLVKPSMPLSGMSNNHFTNPLLSFGQALSNNPLAAVYLGLQQLNAQMTLYSTVLQTSTYVVTDTKYSTKTIRFYDGRHTRYRTTSDPVSTKKRTIITTVTSVQPYINTQAYQQQQQLQKLIAATQLAPIQPQFSTVTSVYTTVTTATSLSTRIYTLIYNGFSTKFRTVTSTTLHPTTVTVTSTKEVPIMPTQAAAPFAYPYPA